MCGTFSLKQFSLIKNIVPVLITIFAYLLRQYEVFHYSRMKSDAQ